MLLLFINCRSSVKNSQARQIAELAAFVTVVSIGQIRQPMGGGESFLCHLSVCFLFAST